MEKDRMITLVVIVLILILSVVIIYMKNKPSTNGLTKELAECIGSKSILYVQTGCPHCKEQEDMFGEFIDNLTIINCAGQINKCIEAGIEKIPTWIINNEKYQGILEISELKELTGC